jgi:hypothetical protein
VRDFLVDLFPRGNIPQWVVDALRFGKIDVADMKLLPDDIVAVSNVDTNSDDA